MRKMIKRGLSVVLAVCLMLSILALPGVTVARAEGETASSLISTPVYSHGMDTLNESDPTCFPSGWTRSSQYAWSSSIQTSNGRTYYQMKRSNGELSKKEGAAISWAVYTPAAAYTAAVLKYDVMIDNGDLTDWSVYLPTFENSSKGDAISLTVKYVAQGDSAVYQLYNSVNPLEYTFTPGEWYTVELVYTGAAWSVYITGENGATVCPVENKAYTNTLSCINMGVSQLGGNSFVNSNNATISGGNVAMNIDDLAVYDYVAGTDFAAATESYEVKAGETVATGWTKTEGAYLPSITFESSNEKVAKVDENGVITGISAGTATITATPAASSGMAAATTTVTVKDPSSIVSEPVYSHAMEELKNFMPTGWALNSQYAWASVANESDGRVYYHMERKGTNEGAAASRTYYQNASAYTASVLKYDIMLDNADLTGWTVYAPSFVNGAGNRTIPINIKDSMTIGSESIEHGKWYTVELVVSGTVWALYVDGEEAGSDTITAAQSETLKYINMGIENVGGNSAENKNGVTVYGVGVSMNIDNLAVYDYVAGTGFAAVTDSYEVAVNESVKPVWTKAPANAFLPYVTYTSSDKTVATVDENGVVTGLKDGTVTITATPSKSSGMSAATTTVVVGTGVQEDILKFSNASLVLQDNLAINFKANADLFTNGGYSDPYAVFTFNNKTYTVEEYNIVDGQYVFQFTDIAPHMMGDDITYKLVATSNGEEVSSTSGTYSVLDYCTDALGKTTNGTLKTLLVDTLNYGAAAQTYKNYNTGDLVNAGLTDDQKALATADRELVKIENLQTGQDGLAAQWEFASLLLDDAITVKLTFEADSKEGLTVKINDAEQEIVDSGTEGTYYVYYPLTPKQLSDTITAQVFNGETVVSKTLSFSAETYAATKAAGGDALADLVTAMMKYGDAAKAYVPAE